MILSCIAAVASIIYLGFEQDNYGKKKKKKKKDDDECLSPTGKTMAFAAFAFWGSFIVCNGFVCMLGMVLKGFQRTAYYPFAASHAGPFAGWAGNVCLFQGFCIATNRAYHCCSKDKKEGDEGEEGGMENPYGMGGPGGMPPGYGPPGAYGKGGYGPPPGKGGYGPPPGAY